VRSTQPGLEALHLLDDISDTVCHAVDAANFCASAHADSAWRSAARQASSELNGYIAKLNTEHVLWDVLNRSMSDESQLKDWTAEERSAGHSLLVEFEQAGLGFGKQKGKQYRELAGQEQALCAKLARFEVRSSSRQI
jgi:Zn-dependent oligopeptidase